ncbi:MAG: hypothetical protein EB039_05230, partial [Proteobacteria bacterium]|nr:hypothetical protein [Pseudomonadota bacterium]
MDLPLYVPVGVGAYSVARGGIGITQFEVEGYEADDILATITKRAEKEGAEVFICTGDRDSFQLVNDKTTVLYP